jgi:hypothetical protein
LEQKDMSDLWDRFIVGFCKVEAVCWNGEPNWFGWILIAVLAFILLMVVVVIKAIIFD